MDIALKQRLVGASVLIALAVVVLPMLFGGRPDDNGATQRIEVPEQPPELDFETRRFPINAAPAQAEAEAPTRDEPVRLPTPESSVTESPPEVADLQEDQAPAETDDQPVQTVSESPPSGTEPVAEEEEPPVAVVTPEPLPQAATRGRGRYVVQVASFGSLNNARRLSDQLTAQGYQVVMDKVDSDTGSLNRVRVGPYESEADADRAVAALRTQLPDIKPRVLDMEPEKASAVTAPSDPLVRWVVQVGSFSSAANADNLVAKLRLEGLSAYKESVRGGSATVYRVRVGPFIEREEAIGVDQKVHDRLGIDGVVMSAD